MMVLFTVKATVAGHRLLLVEQWRRRPCVTIAGVVIVDGVVAKLLQLLVLRILLRIDVGGGEGKWKWLCWWL